MGHKLNNFGSRRPNRVIHDRRLDRWRCGWPNRVRREKRLRKATRKVSK